MPHLKDKNGPQIWIHVDQIEANIRAYQAIQPNGQLMAVIKANAYGLGIQTIMPALISTKVSIVAVFSVAEGRDIRELNSDITILLLREPDESDYNEVMASRIIPTFANAEPLIHFDAACSAAKRSMPIALFFNTGMNWFGRKSSIKRDASALVNAASGARSCQVSDVFTHLPNVELDKNEQGSETQEHVREFVALLRDFADALPKHVRTHVANSQGALSVDQSQFTSMRIGKGLFNNACQLRTTILDICNLDTGESIGYSGEYRADQPCRIAVIEMGYADGLSTHYQDAFVEIGGELYPLVGRVAMDVCYAKIPLNAPAIPGQTVVFFGPKNESQISQDTFAKSMNMNLRQVTCILGSRVKRVRV
ncbi:MAG: alanine racemase [bacterium]|nr:alanine racemase [bacterium]